MVVEKIQAYCADCEEMVEVIREVDGDETGLFEYFACSECLAKIQSCSDCELWRPDDENTLLCETRGTCRKAGRRIHALDLACKNYKKRRWG